MSKLTKFFKHPVRFFQDSKLFGKPDVSGVQKCKNLFFIAHYGQLEQIQALIKYEQLSDCFVCILYTPSNKKMPKLVADNIDHELISGCYLAKLPVGPNRIHIENLIFMRRLYSRIIKKANPSDIYLLSFEVHYALIAAIAKELDISLSLIEEGTATYKFDESGVNLAPIVNPNKFKRQMLAIRYFPFLAKIRPALETARNFDHIYAAFPQLLQNAFSYKTLTRFLLHAPGGKKVDTQTLNVIQKYNISPSDIIFVSQRYSIEPDLFFNSLFDFLSELSQLSGSRVLIKLHPKESASSLKAARRKLDMLGTDSNLILITENEFLIEPTIAYVKPKAVAGIASTSLAYTSLVSPKTAAVSFGSYLIQSLLDAGSQKHKELDVIQSHLDILNKFSKVFKVSTPQLALEAIEQHENTMKTSGGKDVDLLSLAQVYSSEGKYWKAHCYFEWSVEGDIDQLSHNQFKSYYLNLIHLKDYGLIVKYLPVFLKKWEAAEVYVDSDEHILLFESVLSTLDSSIINNNKEYTLEIYNILAGSSAFGAEASLSLRRIYIQIRFGESDVAAHLLQEYIKNHHLSREDIFTLFHVLQSSEKVKVDSKVFCVFDGFLKGEMPLNVYEKDFLGSLISQKADNEKRLGVDDFFDEFKSKLSNNYHLKFVRNRKSKIITIVFQEKFQSIRPLEKSSNVLYFLDSNNNYFTFNPVMQSSYLRSFVEKCGFNRIIFTGEDIGGFGAMLWSLQVNKKNSNLNCRCIVLNPVLDLESTICQNYKINALDLSANFITSGFFKNLQKFHNLAKLDLIKLPPTVILDSCAFDNPLSDDFSNFYNVKVLKLNKPIVSKVGELYSKNDIFLNGRKFKSSSLLQSF